MISQNFSGALDPSAGLLDLSRSFIRSLIEWLHVLDLTSGIMNLKSIKIERSTVPVYMS